MTPEEFAMELTRLARKGMIEGIHPRAMAFILNTAAESTLGTYQAIGRGKYLQLLGRHQRLVDEGVAEMDAWVAVRKENGFEVP